MEVLPCALHRTLRTMISSRSYIKAPVKHANPKPCKSPFGYFGAKLKIAQQIISKLPPHNAWVEVFAGSAALTCAKQPAPIEVINDLDGEIVNLFHHLRTRPHQLIKAVALTPYSKQELEDCRSPLVHCSPLERARRFLVFSMMTVNGTLGSRAGFSFSNSFSRNHHEARVSRWLALPERLEHVVERLRDVRIENRNAVDVVKSFSDRPATLLYLDPPYFVKRRRGYVVDAQHEDFHVELLEACRKVRCMVLLSGYDNPLYRRYLTRAAGWSSETIDTIARDTTGKKYTRHEMLWMNEAFCKARRAKAVQIRLTPEERRQRKLNPRRGRGGQ